MAVSAETDVRRLQDKVATLTSQVQSLIAELEHQKRLSKLERERVDLLVENAILKRRRELTTDWAEATA